MIQNQFMSIFEWIPRSKIIRVRRKINFKFSLRQWCVRMIYRYLCGALFSNSLICAYLEVLCIKWLGCIVGIRPQWHRCQTFPLHPYSGVWCDFPCECACRKRPLHPFAPKPILYCLPRDPIQECFPFFCLFIGSFWLFVVPLPHLGKQITTRFIPLWKHPGRGNSPFLYSL